MRRWIALALLVVVWGSVHLYGSGLVILASQQWTGAAVAYGTGHDALWLGHAWVDGRRSSSDVDSLVTRLRGTGIRDLFVHTGPFDHDGMLDPALRPSARWFVGQIKSKLPGVRVQAWLGAHPVPGELAWTSPAVRQALLNSVAQVLDDGFVGIHYDFEPVRTGDRTLLSILRDTRTVTRQRGALLSVSAVHAEPVPGMADCVSWAVWGTLSLWSGAYLRDVAELVDQVALMSYDTALVSESAYAGYVRRSTEIALAAVPAHVTLFVGVPAYHDQHLLHHRRAETVAAALRGVRLALGPDPSDRPFGVALYVDFAATESDWASYERDWSPRR